MDDIMFSTSNNFIDIFAYSHIAAIGIPLLIIFAFYRKAISSRVFSMFEQVRDVAETLCRFNEITNQLQSIEQTIRLIQMNQDAARTQILLEMAEVKGYLRELPNQIKRTSFAQTGCTVLARAEPVIGAAPVPPPPPPPPPMLLTPATPALKLPTARAGPSQVRNKKGNPPQLTLTEDVVKSTLSNLRKTTIKPKMLANPVKTPRTSPPHRPYLTRSSTSGNRVRKVIKKSSLFDRTVTIPLSCKQLQRAIEEVDLYALVDNNKSDESED